MLRRAPLFACRPPGIDASLPPSINAAPAADEKKRVPAAGQDRERCLWLQPSTPVARCRRTNHARELRRAIIAATVGTTIEWYDFFLYSTMAGLVFGKLFFPNDDPTDRHAQLLRHLFRRLHRAPGRRRHLRPLRRPHRPQIDPHRHPDADGRLDLPGGVPARLWIDRHLGRGLLTLLRALLQGIGVGGEWGGSVLCRWNGRATTTRARLPRLMAAIRRSRRASSSPISRSSPSARCRATPSSPGAGASRSSLASSSSASASGSGSASSRPRCSSASSPSARSSRRRSSRC